MATPCKPASSPMPLSSIFSTSFSCTTPPRSSSSTLSMTSSSASDVPGTGSAPYRLEGSRVRPICHMERAYMLSKMGRTASSDELSTIGRVFNMGLAQVSTAGDVPRDAHENRHEKISSPALQGQPSCSSSHHRCEDARSTAYNCRVTFVIAHIRGQRTNRRGEVIRRTNV